MPDFDVASGEGVGELVAGCEVVALETGFPELSVARPITYTTAKPTAAASTAAHR